MKKTMIAAALIISVTAASAEAGYYKEREYPNITADVLKYEKYDTTRLDELLAELEPIIYYDGHEAEVSEILKSAYDGYTAAQQAYAAAQIGADSLYSAESAARRAEASDTAVEASEKLTRLIEKIYKSDYDYLLEAEFGDANELADYMESLPSDNYYELRKRELELEGEYSEAYGDSGKCAEIFIELVKVRRLMAKDFGYDSYADFANSELYARDYSREEIESFSDEAAKYFKPLARELLAPVSALEDEPVSKTESEVIEDVGDALERINGELKISYEYMLENGLYDISRRGGKSPSGGSYTLTLPEYGVPYLYLTPFANYEEDCAASVKSLIHEFGHYSALLNDPAQDDEYAAVWHTASVDTCEIQSQGLELLAQRFGGSLFGRQASAERYKQMMSKVSVVLDGCFFNEWQTRVYETEDLTVEKCNEMAAELIEKYYNTEYSPEAAQKSWTSVPHNYNAPMYYISYAVSAAAALEIYGLSESDFGEAADKYMRLSALGAYVPYKEAAAICGLRSVFEPGVIKEAADGIMRGCGLSYGDVDYSAWYAPYFYEVSDIFDGESPGIFRPGADITRSDFVTLIGRMRQYYSGGELSGSELSFTDVDADSPSAPYIAWAYENGIVTGFSDDEFGGGSIVTREQLVTMLYRLAKYENSESTGYRADLNRFSDSGEISDWAYTAMGWAADAGIIDGRDGSLIAPKGSATRAESAKVAACYINLAY